MHQRAFQLLRRKKNWQVKFPPFHCTNQSPSYPPFQSTSCPSSSMISAFSWLKMGVGQSPVPSSTLQYLTELDNSPLGEYFLPIMIFLLFSIFHCVLLFSCIFMSAGIAGSEGMALKLPQRCPKPLHRVYLKGYTFLPPTCFQSSLECLFCIFLYFLLKNLFKSL